MLIVHDPFLIGSAPHAAMVKKNLFPLINRSGRCQRAGLGPDILIHAEEVVWIVFRLDLHEALIIIPVRRADPFVALAVHHEIYVRATGSKRGQRLPVIPGPAGNPVHVGWIGVNTGNHLAPGGLTITPWRFVVGSVVSSTV